jgi:hypothetical protein
VREIHEWFRIALACGAGALLFAYSSKERRIESAIQHWVGLVTAAPRLI